MSRRRVFFPDGIVMLRWNLWRLTSPVEYGDDVVKHHAVCQPDAQAVTGTTASGQQWKWLAGNDRYSAVSSARSSNASGILMTSPAAVLRVTTVSNLVGFRTGSSAGLS